MQQEQLEFHLVYIHLDFHFQFVILDVSTQRAHARTLRASWCKLVYRAQGWTLSHGSKTVSHCVLATIAVTRLMTGPSPAQTRPPLCTALDPVRPRQPARPPLRYPQN